LVARRKKASTSTRKPAFDPKGKILCIFGESPLVEEYAVHCVARRFTVHARINSTEKDAVRLLPKGAKAVRKGSPDSSLALELTNTSAELKRKNLMELDKTLPLQTLILTSSITITVAEQTTWVQHPDRIVGIAALPSLLDGEMIEFALPPHPENSATMRAMEFASWLGKEAAFVQDSIGMVLPRIICMLANEACFAMAEGVATSADIDTAMKYGTNYPSGPVEWTDKIGSRQVFAVMRALADSFGEDRYRVAPLLQRSALLNVVPGR